MSRFSFLSNYETALVWIAGLDDELQQRGTADMGQKVGRLPDTWQELIEERDRVLRWSSEVLARVDDNIENEDTFLMDYDNKKIDTKIDRWIANQKYKWEVALARFPDASDSSRNNVKTEIARITEDMRNNMREDYQRAYGRMKNFTKRVDALGIDERKIHAEIQSLESLCENDRKKFATRFGPLRKRVFRNLRTGEKMLFEEKKLRAAFTKKVYDIDHKCMADCAKQFDKLVKNFEKSSITSR